MASPSRVRVLIAGGGIAGLEALLGLHRHAGDAVDLTLLAPNDAFSLRPFAVGKPFSLARPQQLPLREVASHAGADFVRDAVASVDLDRHRVRTTGGDVIDYDALLLAPGARAVDAVPHATTWLPEGEAERFGGLLRDLEEGYASRVAFVIPAGPVWQLPAYELALMTAREVAGMDRRDTQMTVITPEEEPLAVFGEMASEVLREELQAAGVALRTGSVAEVRPGRPVTVALQPGDDLLEVDRVVAVPALAGPALAGVPVDEHGFVRVDIDQRIVGAADAWAAGDGTSFPVKYGGLATHQARRAIRGIAQMAGGDAPPEPEVPTLRGVLMTGRRPRGLGGASPERRSDVPLWTPVGKVAGEYLSEYLERGTAAAPPPPETGVLVEQPLEDAVRRLR
jgi:sulfide:quinone oxidoreductase